MPARSTSSSRLFWPARAAGSILPRALPAVYRVNYRWEFLAAWCIPAVLACVEPGVIGVIAEKALGAGALVIALLYAAPQIGNLAGIAWSRFMHGKDRVRATNAMQLGAIAAVAGIALLPAGPAGVWLLVLLAIAARVCFSGIIAARTDLWRANYPRQVRAGITSRITLIAAGVVALSSGLIALVMPADDAAAAEGGAPISYRAVFLGAAGLGLLGVWATSHLRWRGGAAHLAAERAATDHGADRLGIGEMWSVLRRDKPYRDFMLAQFALGLPNLCAMAPFQLALGPFGMDYEWSILLTQILPTVVPVLTLPLWARVLDRNHILRFRAYHSWLFVFANLFTYLGLVLHSVPLLVLARLILGIAFGGGMIAWDLGHHDFADRRRAHVYMGIHVTLTGIRGVIAPFLGVWLFAAAATSDELFGLIPLGGAGLGAGTFLLLSGVSLLAALMFVRLHLAHRRSAAR